MKIKLPAVNTLSREPTETVDLLLSKTRRLVAFIMDNKTKSGNITITP